MNSKRCMNCMKIYKNSLDVCPYCGYKENTLAKEAHHLQPGTLLADRYTIGTVLGVGGFGITYRAWDRRLEQIVTVKEYYPTEIVNRIPGQDEVIIYTGERLNEFQKGKESFLSEARIMTRFSTYPSIIKEFDFFEANNTAYIVMEYLEGESLKQKIDRDKKISVEEALPLILSILSDIEKVHAAGIIHCNIAPDNIYLTSYGGVRLIDFSLTKTTTSIKNNESLSVIIKSGYSAEEQYRSKGNIGPWTDVYALAATFYKVITSITPPEAIERSYKDTIKLPSELNVEITKNIELSIMNALNVKIDDRTQSATEFKKELLSSEVKARKATKARCDAGKLSLWVKIIIFILVLVLFFIFVLIFI